MNATPAERQPPNALLIWLVGAGLMALVLLHSGGAYLAAHDPTRAALLPSVEAPLLQREAGARIATLLEPLISGERPAAAMPATSQMATSAEDSDNPLAGFAETARGLAPPSASSGTGSLSANERPVIRAPADTAAERATLRNMVERALTLEPLSARGLRLLGVLAELDGDDARAETMMRASAGLSRRETMAVQWLLVDAYAKRDAAAALRYADILLRSRLRGFELAMPVLGRLSEDVRARPSVRELMASNPAWRSRFFAELPRHIGDARSPLALLLALKDTPAPATPGERETYIRFLASRSLDELAYYTWLQFLPPEQLKSLGYINNGGFERLPEDVPFDWTVPGGSGRLADFTPCPGEGMNMCLDVELTGAGQQPPPISQRLLLPAGDYVLTLRAQGEVIGRRGLLWSVVCAGKGSNPVLGASEMLVGAFPKWRRLEIAFSVPGNGCRAQELTLRLDARSASELLATGRMWFDDVAVTRRTAAPAANSNASRDATNGETGSGNVGGNADETNGGPGTP